jgi:hypothetical protein
MTEELASHAGHQILWLYMKVMSRGNGYSSISTKVLEDFNFSLGECHHKMSWLNCGIEVPPLLIISIFFMYILRKAP